jgi:hypothetical protein
MIAIIDRQPWVCCNKDLVKDILAVLGECFTRNVIRLYNNHCNVIVYSDDMNDTMIPGYAYCESFVFDENDEFVQEAETQQGEKPAPPDVSFGQNTVQKTGVLNKLTTLIRQFGQWISKKLGGIPALFETVNGAKVAWITSHSKLNEEIGNAIANGSFKPNLSNFPLYKIPLNEMNSKASSVQQVLEKYANNPNEAINKEAIKMEIYPGNNETAKAIAQMNDTKKEAEAIQNFTLFSDITPDPKVKSFNGVMSPQIWKDMTTDLANSKRLIDEAVKPMVQSLNNGLKVIEKIQKQDESNANKAKNVNEAESATPQQNTTGRADTMFNIFKEITQTYQMNVLNSLTNNFFNTYYTAYKKIVDAYQSSVGKQQAQTVEQQTKVESTDEANNNQGGK